MKWSRQATQESVDFDSPSHTPTPSSVSGQLSECAEEDPAELSSRITEILGKLRRSLLAADQQFRLIELCSDAALGLRRDLDRLLAGSGLPLPNDKQEAACRCAETYWSIAQWYKDVAAEFVARGDRHPGDVACLLRACYQGISNLGEYLLIDYERYAKVRKGVWLDIHRFYSVAHSEGLKDIQVGVRDDRPLRTVEHVYKKVLLLGLSDPFHQPTRGPVQIYSRLDQWAQLALLTTTPPRSGRCAFTVNPDIDRPAMPGSARPGVRPESHEKFLVTRNLVDKLKTQHRSAVKLASRRGEESREVSRELGSIELLRRLIVNWSFHPIRHAVRTRTRKRCDMVVGVKPVCTVLNGFKPLVGRKTRTTGKWAVTMKRTLTRPDSGLGDFSRIVNTWDIEDESERGWGLAVADDIAANRLRVGELVAIRTGYDWQIGAVRWAQSDDDNKLYLGIRKIMRPAWPALACRLQPENSRAPDVHPALLLVDKSDSGNMFSLLCDKRLYHPTGVYLVRLVGEYDQRVFESTDVRQSTRAFVWFEVRKSEAGTTGPPAV